MTCRSPEPPTDAEHRAAVRLPRRVLYVQHAGCLGGSAMSLKYLVQGMQAAGVDCTVALARPSVALQDFYREAGIPTLPAPDICCWDHSTVAPRHLTNPRHVLDLAAVATRWGASRKATLSLVERLHPDLVHLNSMPLSSSACALLDAEVPFVWHVREPPPDQGLRTLAIRRIMLRTPHCVFITRYDRDKWVGDATGRIIYNCVPDDWFAARPIVPKKTGPSDPVRFAYLGGASIPKGVETLLGALRILDTGGIPWECVMPGFLPDPGHGGRERLLKRIARRIGYRNIGERLLPKVLAFGSTVRPLPFARNIRPVLAEADFVVFPALSPHFPRPVIEAAALGKPAVGTAVGGVDECIVPGVSGILCDPGDAKSLAAALGAMIRDAGLRRSLGMGAYERSIAVHSSSAQHKAVGSLYGHVLAGRSVTPQGAE